jgi:hypothetical protein
MDNHMLKETLDIVRRIVPYAGGVHQAICVAARGENSGVRIDGGGSNQTRQGGRGA